MAQYFLCPISFWGIGQGYDLQFNPITRVQTQNAYVDSRLCWVVERVLVVMQYYGDVCPLIAIHSLSGWSGCFEASRLLTFRLVYSAGRQCDSTTCSWLVARRSGAEMNFRVVGWWADVSTNHRHQLEDCLFQPVSPVTSQIGSDFEVELSEWVWMRSVRFWPTRIELCSLDLHSSGDNCSANYCCFYPETTQQLTWKY